MDARLRLPITRPEYIETSDGYWCPKHPHAWCCEKRVGGDRSFDLMWCDGTGVVDYVAHDLPDPILGGEILMPAPMYAPGAAVRDAGTRGQTPDPDTTPGSGVVHPTEMEGE